MTPPQSTEPGLAQPANAGASLLDGLEVSGGALVARPASPPLLQRARVWLAADPVRRQRALLAARIGAITVAAALGIGSFFAFRPVPQPDYATDGIADIFNYTLLTDEFNQLPVEERLKLIQQLIARMKSMSAGDSAMMAAFAAGIAGSAREQLERNGSRLMIDSWDKFAVDYGKLPPDASDAERDAFMDKTLVDFIKMGEALGGRVRDISDEKRLEDIRKGIARDREWMNKPENQPGQREFGRMWVFLESTVGQHSSPVQRARGTQLMRDMGRRLRDESITTGKPRSGG